MAQKASHQPLTGGPGWSQASACGPWGGQSDTGTGSAPSTLVSHQLTFHKCSVPILHSHSHSHSLHLFLNQNENLFYFIFGSWFSFFSKKCINSLTCLLLMCWNIHESKISFEINGSSISGQDFHCTCLFILSFVYSAIWTFKNHVT
jgi:hypothetical protein